jgi:hypothetical protein
MRPSDRAWLALGAGVLAWDVACPDGEMLSQASDRYAQKHRWLAYSVIASVALHLTSLLPYWVDPVHAVGVMLRKIR